jgi:hypothetical protein
MPSRPRKALNGCHSINTGAVVCLIIHFNTYMTMKEFLQTMGMDILSENFTRKQMVVYGVIVPVVFIALMAIAGWMDSLINNL